MLVYAHYNPIIPWGNDEFSPHFLFVDRWEGGGGRGIQRWVTHDGG